ncbi:hypothetical protein [Aestuariimicrobium ganziense]|uniref:hypothetical protein n=1 Tax=Aestuariimicrobium ganziense TaxID=2773677 RepID=UPI0019430F84|nr:hypothetical protein [Aestuariimicrobium ganziense]
MARPREQHHSGLIDTTQVPLQAPERGPVIGRTLLVMVLALLLAGVLGGLMALFGDPMADELGTGGEDVVRTIGLGLLVGLAAFFVLVVPVVVIVAVAHQTMVRSVKASRVVVAVGWFAITVLVLVVTASALGSAFVDALKLLWAPVLLVGVALVALAPWMVWGRMRPGRQDAR